jgi:hypothetical protein
MTDFQALKDLVKKKGFGTALYGNVNGEAVYLSRGIREVFLGDGDTQSVIDAVARFQAGDYGDAAEHGKTGKPGHEYGRYVIGSFENHNDEDTGVWVHTAEDAVIVYFRFER